MWEEEVQRKFPVGALVSGIVREHRHFGVFVDLGDLPTLGLIQIVDFMDEGRMTPELYPAIGQTIEAEVLGYRASNKQVWLGAKSSQLRDRKRSV